MGGVLRRASSHASQAPVTAFTRGVRLSIVTDLVLKHARPGMTTKQFTDEVVKPMTADKGCALADHLARKDPTALKPVADVFISLAWSYVLEDLLRAVAAQCKAEGLDPSRTYVWLDMVVVNQHQTEELPESYFYDTFREAVRSIGRMYFVAMPWEQPTPLTRSWCLFELYSSVVAEAELVVVVDGGEKARFVETLTSKFSSIMTAITGIDVSRAEAFKKEDQAKILKLVEDGPGVEAVNEAVKTQLRGWYAETGRGALREMEAQGTGDTTEAADLAIWVGRLLQDLVGSCARVGRACATH